MTCPAQVSVIHPNKVVKGLKSGSLPTPLIFKAPLCAQMQSEKIQKEANTVCERKCFTFRVHCVLPGTEKHKQRKHKSKPLNSPCNLLCIVNQFGFDMVVFKALLKCKHEEIIV